MDPRGGWRAAGRMLAGWQARHRGATPTVLQMEAVECGAAALAMVLGHYGRWVPLEELRVACGVSRDGSKASNVLRVARTFGMQAKGYKKEPAGLRDLKLPLIVFWNFNHFLVVEAFAGGRVYLNDPAAGRRWVTEEEFDQSFTGVVLAISPGPGYRPGGQAPSVLRALASRFSGHGGALWFLLLCGLALVLPGLVIPVFARVFVDEILIDGRQSWLLPLLVGMGATAVLRAVFKGFEQHYLLRVETKMALAQSARFFWHVLRLPVEFYTQRSAGDIGTRVQIADDVARILTADLTGSLLALLTSLFFGTLLFFYDPLLAAVAVGSVAISLAAMHHAGRRNRELARRLAMDGGKMMGASMNGLTVMETIKSTGGEAGFFAKWAGYQARFLNSQQQVGRLGARLAQVPALLTALGNALILGIGATRVMDGAMTMGTLVAFQSLVASFTAPAQQLVGVAGKLQQAQGDVARLDDVMRYRVDPLAPAPAPAAGAASARLARKLTGHIEFRNVSFGYSRAEPPLLDGFDLTLAPGQRIALVGPSGCGKSTVSKLLMGLYQPWSGEILFDGQPRDAYERYALVNSIGMVDQDIVLFSGSVRDNITMWDATIADADVARAAQDACIHEAILARPGGYDAAIDEGGRNFSGGQRQRIEIARALVNNPRILVLDEATSALDVATEQQVDDNLRRRGCTCLIVAHRLSTVRDADEILVLNQGKVVQRGTHAAMMAAGPDHYRRLVAPEGGE
jgi:NHLM bacteriocin system ABC transporter peptidase/ATP-binding protein